MSNPMDMHQKTVLVTGASSGIGRATAILLSTLGARVVLVARSEEKLEETRSQMSGDNHRIEVCDLSQTDSLPSWLKTIAGEEGELHGLAHCAGAHLLLPLQMQKTSQVEDLFRINVVSAIMLAKAFRQKGVHASPSSIVFVSSVMGTVGQAGRSAYCASKGALHSLTRALALELSKEHIRVNCIAPAGVATDMGEDAAAAVGEDGMKEILRMHPLGIGEPLDVAHSIAYLLADTGRWITGAIQMVDGGYTAH